jgi:hypothetical protein
VLNSCKKHKIWRLKRYIFLIVSTGPVTASDAYLRHSAMIAPSCSAGQSVKGQTTRQLQTFRWRTAMMAQIQVPFDLPSQECGTRQQDPASNTQIYVSYSDFNLHITLTLMNFWYCCFQTSTLLSCATTFQNGGTVTSSNDQAA